MTVITSDSKSFLGYVCRKVDAMKVGEHLTFSRHDLMAIPSTYHNDTQFTPPDRVLGNIVGSAYTHSYRENPRDDTVTFFRHEDTGERHYTDPDRRPDRRAGALPAWAQE